MFDDDMGWSFHSRKHETFWTWSIFSANAKNTKWKRNKKNRKLQSRKLKHLKHWSAGSLHTRDQDALYINLDFGQSLCKSMWFLTWVAQFAGTVKKIWIPFSFSFDPLLPLQIPFVASSDVEDFGFGGALRAIPLQGPNGWIMIWRAAGALLWPNVAAVHMGKPTRDVRKPSKASTYLACNKKQNGWEDSVQSRFKAMGRGMIEWCLLEWLFPSLNVPSPSQYCCLHERGGRGMLLKAVVNLGTATWNWTKCIDLHLDHCCSSG